MGNQANTQCCVPDDGGELTIWDVSNRLPFPQGFPVHLNVYHLNNEWQKSNQISKQLFGLGGAFHAGIEVHGVEWAYGDEGISSNDPRTHEVHVYHESIQLGETDLSADEVVTLVKKMKRDWLGQEYHMLDRNCCNFADVFSQELVGEPIPSWVTRFPHIASQAAAHLDEVIDVNGIVGCMCDVAPGGAPPVPPAKADLAYSNLRIAARC